jgi:hypothetical protein
MNMNKRNPENFIHALKQLQLSETSRNAMRDRLVAYADLHEMPSRKAVVSPYFIYRFGFVGALAVILLVGGVSVSYAANNTLPGQALYGVKVHVNEPLASAFIPTTSGKAEYENVLTERRLTEASTLAAQHKLNDENRTFLEQQVTLHAENSQESAAKLAKKGENDKALSIRSDLEARLSAHADLLAVIAPRIAATGDTGTSGEVATLFQKVESERSAAMRSRVATEVAIVDQAQDAPKKGASGKPHPTSAAHPSQTSASGAAFIESEHVARVEETQALFAKRAATVLSLLPATTTATTTLTATSTATTTVKILPPKIPNHEIEKLEKSGEN